MRPKHSAGKLFSPTNAPMRNLALARFGDAVWTERQESFLKLVGWFENAAKRKGKARIASESACERRFDLVARPVLIRALLEQDPQPFRDFIAVIEAARRIKKDRKPVHPLQDALLLIELERLDTRGRKLTISQLTNKLCERLPEGVEPAQVRRECDNLGIPYKAGKRGRPKSNN